MRIRGCGCGWESRVRAGGGPRCKVPWGTDRSCQADQRPACNPALPPTFCGRQGFHPARGPVAGRLGPSSACSGGGSLTGQHGGSGRGRRGYPQQPRASGLQQGRHLFQPGPQAQPVFQSILAAIAQGLGVCKLSKPPASRALCQAKRAPRAAFPSACLAAQTKRWAEGIRVPAPLPGRFADCIELLHLWLQRI